MSILGCKSQAALELKVISINIPHLSNSMNEYEIKSCQNWEITKEDAEKFFKTSKYYNETNLNLFDLYDCSVSGKLIYDNKTWNFEINSSGWAEWFDGLKYRYYGCLEGNECYQYLD